MNPQAARSDIPRTGMLATVRNRTGVIAAVEPFDGDDGRIHLVHLEYQDENAPGQERLLWELEPERDLLEPTALPDPSDTDAMLPEDFDALFAPRAGRRSRPTSTRAARAFPAESRCRVRSTAAYGSRTTSSSPC